MWTNEIKNELDEITGWGEPFNKINIKYETNKRLYDFQQLKAIKYIGESLTGGKIITKEVDEDQSNLTENTVEFNNKSRPSAEEEKIKKRNTFGSANVLYEGRELILNAFKIGVFPLKPSQGKGLKILTPRQMLQSLPIALAQVKASNPSENLLSKIWKIKYSLYRAKEITKKAYNNIMNSIKLFIQNTSFSFKTFSLQKVKSFY